MQNNQNCLQTFKTALDEEVNAGNIDAPSGIDMLRTYKVAQHNSAITTLAMFNDYLQGDINIWELGDALEVLE